MSAGLESVPYTSFSTFRLDNRDRWYKMDCPVLHLAGGTNHPLGRQDSYILTRRNDILEALHNTAVFRAHRPFIVPGVELLPTTLEPPEHTRFRKLIAPSFGPRAATAMTPALRKLARELDQDSITDYASIGTLAYLGLPTEDHLHVARLADRAAPSSPASSPQTQLELVQWLRSTLPAATPVGATAQLRDTLNHDELIGLLSTLLIAGPSATEATIIYAVAELLQSPPLQTQLRQNPNLIRAFAEEVIRLRPAVPIIPRITATETTIAGVTFAPNTTVVLFLGLHSRAPGTELLADGKIHRHWGFGAGPHRCLGMHLARTQLTSFITEWLHRS